MNELIYLNASEAKERFKHLMPNYIFELDSFYSYNINTNELTLLNGKTKTIFKKKARCKEVWISKKEKIFD